MLLATLSVILPTLQANMNTRLPGLTHKVGARFIQAEGGGNRVVWAPLRDTFQPGRQQPGVRRVTRVRVLRLLVHLWGVSTQPDNTIIKNGDTPTTGWRDSLGQTEAMINALLCALEDSAKACQYDVEDGAWGEQTGESIAEWGLTYAATVSLRVPVVYDELAITPVNAMSVTGTFQALDGTTTTHNPPP